MAGPQVSIIMAAYNRSNVLRLAVCTVIAQTFTDWELIIAGDACTDDTEAVAASFSDPRIRFINLEKNTGEQSGPNNHGYNFSRGRYIAYLNQDDLWFPDHLEKCLAAAANNKADWVYGLACCVHPQGITKIAGIMPGNRFSPLYGQSIFASQWLIKREVLENLGGWRSFRDIWMVPSQDLMLRGHKAGYLICGADEMTLILIQSATRSRSYADRACSEHLLYFESMELNAERLRQELILAALRYLELSKKSVVQSLKTALWALFCSCSAKFGISPFKIYHIIRFGRKSAWLNHMRRVRGLEKI